MKTSRAAVGRAAGQIPVLLRTHARTMALSLRLLPRPLREALGLAYLLARASDTIADSGTVFREARIAWLERLAAGGPVDPAEGREFPREGFTARERELLDALPGLTVMLASSGDRDELADLWRQILEAQILDLRRFTPGTPPLDRQELERYCDLVAGSVGRSWTRLIARHEPRILKASPEELLPLASDYGRGLQLLNILRDRWADRTAGRSYVTEENVQGLIRETERLLLSGARYCALLRPGRILTASALPLDLARATLPRVAAAGTSQRAKLSRTAVRWVLVRACTSLWLPRRADPA